MTAWQPCAGEGLELLELDEHQPRTLECPWTQRREMQFAQLERARYHCVRASHLAHQVAFMAETIRCDVLGDAGAGEKPVLLSRSL